MNTQYKRNITDNTGYFKAPDLIFDIHLSPNAKLVLLNLCRRSNKNGYSFPSLNKICQDTGIKSTNTISKGIKELCNSGLLVKLPPSNKGSSNRYQLSELIVGIIKKNNKSENLPYSNFEHPPSKNEYPPTQQVSTKENTYKENINKENSNFAKNTKFSYEKQNNNKNFSVRENEEKGFQEADNPDKPDVATQNKISSNTKTNGNRSSKANNKLRATIERMKKSINSFSESSNQHNKKDILSTYAERNSGVVLKDIEQANIRRFGDEFYKS